MSHPTAIKRTKVTRPTAWLLDHVDMEGKYILHHGRGKAYIDTIALGGLGFGADVVVYDPYEDLVGDRAVLHYGYDVVVSNYVLNVLDPAARKHAYDDIRMALVPGGVGYIAVRTDVSNITGRPYEDGVITQRHTFQARMNADEWLLWFPDGVRLLHRGSGFAIFTTKKS